MRQFLQACQTLFMLCLVMGSIFLWQGDAQGGFYTRLFAWSLFGIGAGGCAIWTIFGLWQKYDTGGGVPRNCPECGATLPFIRIPKSKREALWGGIICPKCGSEFDRHGKKVPRDGEPERNGEPGA